MILAIITIGLSTAALFISVIAWQKSRAVYDVERKLFFRKPDRKGPNNNNELKKKLMSGKYTILHTGDYGGYIELILGKLKK